MLPDRSSAQVWQQVLAALLALLAVTGLILPGNACPATVAGRSTMDLAHPTATPGDGRFSPATLYHSHSLSFNPHDIQCPSTAAGREALSTRSWPETATPPGLRPTRQGATPSDDGLLPRASCLNATAQPHENDSSVLRI